MVFVAVFVVIALAAVLTVLSRPRNDEELLAQSAALAGSDAYARYCQRRDYDRLDARIVKLERCLQSKGGT